MNVSQQQAASKIGENAIFMQVSCDLVLKKKLGKKEKRSFSSSLFMSSVFVWRGCARSTFLKFIIQINVPFPFLTLGLNGVFTVLWCSFLYNITIT